MSLFSFQDIITATTGILILLTLVLALSVIMQGGESETTTEFADSSQVFQRDNLLLDVKQLSELVLELNQASSMWIELTPSELKTKIKTADSKKERLARNIQEKKSSIENLNERLAEINRLKNSEDVNSKIEKIKQNISEVENKITDLKSTNRVVYNFRNSTRTPWLVEISEFKIIASKISSKDKPKQFKSPEAFNKFSKTLDVSEKYFVLFVKPSGQVNYDVIYHYLNQENCDIGTEVVGENQTIVDPVTGANF